MGQSAECFYNKCGECITRNGCSCSCHNRNFYKNVMPPLLKTGRLLSVGTVFKDYNHNEDRDIMRKSRGRPPKIKKELNNVE